MSSQIFKYIVYLVTLPLIGFASMYIFKPLTAGAHDGGFLGMVLGLTIGQIVSTLWLTNLKWYFSIPFGLLLAGLTIFISYWTIGTIRDIYNPIKDGSFFRAHNEELENALEWIFFIVLVLSSVLILEGVNKITRRKI